MSYLLTPQLSTNGMTYNPSMADNYSWMLLNNNISNRQTFAKMVYVVNAQGTQGGSYLTGTNTLTGSFGSIYTVATTVFSGLSGDAIISGLSGVSIPANVTLTGVFNAIKLTSGAVIAYN